MGRNPFGKGRWVIGHAAKNSDKTKVLFDENVNFVWETAWLRAEKEFFTEGDAA